MSASQPASPRRRSTRNTVAKWIVIACAVVVLVIVTFVRVTSHRAEMLLQELRDSGAPVCAADIEFDSSVPPSDLEVRTRNMIRSDAVWIDPDSPDLDHQLTTLEAWPAGGAALPAVREYFACIKSVPAAKPVSKSPVKVDSSSPPKLKIFVFWSAPRSWDELVRACMDPQGLDHLTDCQRTGIQALDALNEPLVPAALDACRLSRETGERAVRDSKSSQLGPDLSALFHVADGARVLRSTIPELLLRADSHTALERVEAILHAAESIRGLPWEWGHRIWMSTVTTGLDGCRLLLASHADELDWTTVLHRLESFDPPANLERALVGSRAFGIESFQAARSGRVEPNSWLAQMSSDVYATDVDGGADFSLYLEVMGESIELARKPIFESPRGPRDWQQDRGEFPLWAELSWHLLPTVDELRAKTYALEMDIALARIAIAASQHGAEAAMKTAESTVDVFDGRAVRTLHDAHVLTIWSVGMNLVDDGGSSEQELADNRNMHKHVLNYDWSKSDGTPHGEDIVWRVRLHE